MPSNGSSPRFWKPALGLFGVASLASSSALVASPDEEEATPPDTIVVTGIVRDFQEHSVPGGHPDFEHRPDHGFGRYSGNIAEMIGPDRKPVFTGAGNKVASQWRDSENRQICFRMYDPDRGDVEGSFSHADDGGIHSAATFAQWFRDEPGVNLSDALSLSLRRETNGHYVFDDRTDPEYMDRGGFFPIDDRLFGNSDGSTHNFHFTYELHMGFEYDADGDQFFLFTGDDDVWVFVNDHLVVDLGGVHAAHDQYIDMNRLGLTHGEQYSIDFFFAERFRPQSNFRIETNIPIYDPSVMMVTKSYD